MTIDWTKPIETLEGYPARVISTDYRDGSTTLMVVQVDSENTSFILRFTKDGIRMYHSVNIRNRKTKREGWVNVYRSSRGEVPVGAVYPTKGQAEENNTDAVATIKIEWEE